ncbi:hypothetical protein [Spiroplasma endosymbiont of Megaselia nigra]|uniref:hypothetical protein n=1 Tax=Spiroplasma endosymbiont of Megaselia nigra TaxID=2478537 RepID=UPI000F86E4C4|nr:hypothetical protein [Spiroplasma endosymbiont of Megaselia nigra]RUO86684.1 hypothetical protein D9R21_01565 [Spiroplasma endosymbiont of Megaselia nigra]
MKLGEIKDQSFFVHDDIVKYKMNIIPNKNESMCSIVTVGNIKNKSLNNIVYNDKICNISNETIVAKWNINYLRLKIYSFNNFVNVLLDSKFNAYDFRNTNMWSSLSFNIHNYSFYEGEVIFDVIDGLISTDSIKLHKSKFNNDKENILDLLYSKFVNNLDREKNIIFNTLFIENKLFNYINSLEERLDLNKNSLDDSVIFNLRQVLDIIKFCGTKSDFFNALINIRSIRNLIFGYIFENYFLVKYRNIITIDRELSFKQEFINLSEQNKIFNNDLEEDKKMINILKKLLSKSKKNWKN